MSLVLNALRVKLESQMEGAWSSTRDAGLYGTTDVEFL